MLLHSSQDESDIVYRTWGNHVTTQVRDMSPSWKITCWFNFDGYESSADIILSNGDKTFDEMTAVARELTERIEANAHMMALVLYRDTHEIMQRCQTIDKPYTEGVSISLHSWALERIEKDLRSHHVRPIEIIDHVKAFLDDLQSKIDDEMASDQ